MKNLVLMSLFVGSVAMAEGIFEDKDFGKICKKPRISKDGDSVLCTGAGNYSAVKKAVMGKKNLAKLPAAVSKNLVDPIFDLEVLPDAVTNYVYSYNRPLLDASDRVVGYMTVQGLDNYEAEVKLEVVCRYNTRGELVSAGVDY